MIDKYDFIIQYILGRANAVRETHRGEGFKMATDAINAWEAIQEEQENDEEKTT
jgi:hypothetical protein